MKNLNIFIQEGLRINKNTKIKSYKDPKIKIGDKTIFSKDEINEIKENCYDLPIIPDIITNYPNFQPKDTKRNGKSYSLACIILGYYVDSNKRTEHHNNNLIRIKKDQHENQYFVRFVRVDQWDTYFYPEEQDKYFESIKECFDCIKKEWESIKFSEVINKYK